MNDILEIIAAVIAHALRAVIYTCVGFYTLQYLMTAV